MPIYEYQCLTCGRREEMISKPGHPAPMCCRLPMKQLISLPAWTPSRWGDSKSFGKAPPGTVDNREFGDETDLKNRLERQMEDTASWARGEHDAKLD